jgi:hypothetical protein
VTVAGRARRFTYDRATRTVVVRTGRLSTRRTARIVARR